MEVNTFSTQQNNNTAATTAAVQQTQKQENNAQRVTPTKESADTGADVRKSFDQDRLIKDAIERNVIVGETQLFNFRVTRYANNLTFTDVTSGETTTVGLNDVVGERAIDASL